MAHLGNSLSLAFILHKKGNVPNKVLTGLYDKSTWPTYNDTAPGV